MLSVEGRRADKTEAEPDAPHFGSGQQGAPPPERKDSRARSRWLGYLLNAAIAVGIYLALTAFQSRNLLATGLEQRAPGFELSTLDAGPVRLTDQRGKTVLLHFWATWCNVCESEIAMLNALHQELEEDQILLSIVADSESPERIKNLVAEHGIRYPVLLGTSELLSAYRVDSFPTNYVVRPNGSVGAHSIGMSTRWALGMRMDWLRSH
jgi:thiol-disulfide isomerase/thioredoxin